MEELKVVGVENGALLVATDEGARFRVEVDDVLQSRLRQSMPDPGNGRRLAPREIQAHIRAGMSAEDVASVTGASLEYIRRFEGPVLAEREYVIESALNVPVHIAVETDPLAEGATFGTVIRSRLGDSGAIGERWASWKEQGGGWIVKLTFIAEQVDHDARWGFDPKRQTLVPLNSEAITLSQQGDLPASLIPRLRVVTIDQELDSAPADSTRFDSGAFEVTESDDSAPRLEPLSFGPRPTEEEQRPSNQTADLLDALRRRRGEREPLDLDEDSDIAAFPSTGTVRIVDVPLDGVPDAPIAAVPTGAIPTSTGAVPIGSARGRKGRAAMPSWDEIVFGARADDELI